MQFKEKIKLVKELKHTKTSTNIARLKQNYLGLLGWQFNTCIEGIIIGIETIELK
jgi:hypothetical protein